MKKFLASSSSMLWSCWTPHQPWRAVLALYASWNQSLIFVLCRWRLPSPQASRLLLSLPLIQPRSPTITASLFSPFFSFVGVLWIQAQVLMLGQAISRHPRSLSCVNRALNSLPLSTKTPYKNNLRAKFINLLMNSPGVSQVLPPPVILQMLFGNVIS